MTNMKQKKDNNKFYKLNKLNQQVSGKQIKKKKIKAII
jgi:hypothetical protein